jgi:hypothetical protein
MNKKLIGVLLFGCLVTSGCAKAVLEIAGMDPDEVEIGPAERHVRDTYKGTINRIDSLQEPLKSQGAIFIPSRRRVEEFLDKNGYLEQATIAYRDAVFEAIGSKRSISEIRAIVVPAAIHNTYMDISHGLVEALKARRLFGSLEVVEKAEYSSEIFNQNGTAIIIDYPENKGLMVHVISDGYRSSASGHKVFKGAATGANLKFTRFLGWVEGAIEESTVAATNEEKEFVSSSVPIRISPAKKATSPNPNSPIVEENTARTSKPVSTSRTSDRGGWITIGNRTNCKVWNPYPEPDESVSWSGECIEGKLNGEGVLEWRVNGQVSQTNEGTYKNGVEVGPHKIVDDDYQYIGGLEDGKYEGEGTYISTKGDGLKYVGEWSNGKQHGLGIMTNPSPDIHKYVGGFNNGKLHGKGVVHEKNGETLHVEFINGQLLPSQAEIDRASREAQNTALLKRQAEAAEQLADEAKTKRRMSAFEGILKGLSILSGGSPSSTSSSYSSSSSSGGTCFFKSDRVSGFNRICTYDCLGSDTPVTVNATDICKLSIRR